MKRQIIDATAQSTAPVDQVWALLADVTTWTDWGRWSDATIEQPGTDTPGGVGAIRRFHVGRTTTRERVVAMEAPRRMSYELLSGLPIRKYHADVTLSPAPGGATDIRWHSEFEGLAPVQGGLMRMFLGRFIADCARRVARAADVRDTTPRS